MIRTLTAHVASASRGSAKASAALAALLFVTTACFAQPAEEAGGGEAALKLPDLKTVSFLNNSINGHKLLLIGLLFSSRNR